MAPRSTLAEGIELCVGDRIRWTRNDGGLCLVNSQIEQVTAANDGRVTFRPEDGRTLAVNVGDPQLRHIDRAWALTVHAFQGRTVDNVIAAIEANHPNLGAAIGEHFITERARGGHPARSVAARSRSRMARRGDRALRPVLGGADRTLVGAAGDSERHVVAVEEVELPVVARAFGMARFAEFVVVASDLSEVLTIEDDGEVVEDLGDESGGLVAELVVHDEVTLAGSRYLRCAAGSRRRCFGVRCTRCIGCRSGRRL